MRGFPRDFMCAQLAYDARDPDEEHEERRPELDVVAYAEHGEVRLDIYLGYDHLTLSLEEAMDLPAMITQALKDYENPTSK